MNRADDLRQSDRYARFCTCASRLGALFGTRSRMLPQIRVDALETDLQASCTALDAVQVVLAARAIGGLVLAALLLPALVSLALLDYASAAAWCALALLVSLGTKQAVLVYPGSRARREAAEVMRTYTRAGNLMIMSVRHEPSIPKAVKMASRGHSAFAIELKKCAWSVLMGKHSSFEEALQELGDKWSHYGGDLKSSINALVTASRERTEEGKRRALDRANNAMISGAKKRIEEYSLSLSTPSMILFGLGILLPLMVGSFLPMLSWDLLAGPVTGAGGDGPGTSDSMLPAAILMNAVFPSVAFIVASEAVGRHPMELTTERLHATRSVIGRTLAVSAAGCACAVAALTFLDGLMLTVALSLSALLPAGISLVILGKGTSHVGRDTEIHDDLLFRTGARMLEGENFEAALARAGREISAEASAVASQFALGIAATSENGAEGNTPEGLCVVRDAAGKNELNAGMLAMDLASYIRDLRELEGSLKRRLKPTISMMRMTAHALGPMVLGITFAMFVSLSSIGTDSVGHKDTETMFLIMALFLAETNAVVCYFVWGIEGRKHAGQLASSTGACLLVSQSIFSATALLAA